MFLRGLAWLVVAAANMSKRKDAMPRGEGDKLDITPLGAGNEVGRSCVVMTYKDKTVLVSALLPHTSFAAGSHTSCPLFCFLRCFISVREVIEVVRK